MTTNSFQRARLARGLTLQQVVDRLASHGVRLTRAALHKYEAGLSSPSPRVLIPLAQVLETRPDHLLTQPRIGVEWLAFRRHSTLPKAAMGRVQALASKVVEHQVGLQKLLNVDHLPRFPRKVRVRRPADAERLAQLVRRSWKLGDAPLESVTRTIEDHGGVVVEVQGMDRGFDGLSGIADGRIPVLVINGIPSADRRRYTLAHELAHLAMDCEGIPEREQEPLAHRFAGAFIVPEAVARRELGAKRRHLDWSELKLLKLKHGLSMQAWIRRARDLEIIGPGLYTRLFRQIGALGWRRVEPVVYDAERPPSKLRQLVFRALAEGCVSAAEADEILRDAVALGDRTKTGGSHRGAVDLLYASAEERERRLNIAAEAAVDTYAADSEIRGFDAFGEKDLHDDQSPD